MKLFQWRYSLLLLPIALWLPVNNAQAAAVDCTVSMPDVNLGTTTPTNVDNPPINTTLTYTCTNNVLIYRDVSVCLAVDGGDYNQSMISPRYMKKTDPTPRLAFTMTLPESGNAVWGSRNYSGSTEYKSDTERIPAGATKSFNVPIRISLLSVDTLATPGIYTDNFSAGSTAMSVDISNLFNLNPNCSRRGGLEPNIFPFKVQATVIKDCKVTTTGALDFGNVLSASTPTTSATQINVTCTNTTPYNIGLASVNNPKNNTGAGFMKGTGTNTDTVPYQLQYYTNGRVWGNTATSTSVGNGVAGTGTGVVKEETVFATVPNSSTDVKPDKYSDTVKIRVNY